VTQLADEKPGSTSRVFSGQTDEWCWMDRLSTVTSHGRSRHDLRWAEAAGYVDDVVHDSRLLSFILELVMHGYVSLDHARTEDFCVNSRRVHAERRQCIALRAHEWHGSTDVVVGIRHDDLTGNS
jgi:hypothetical protein